MLTVWVIHLCDSAFYCWVGVKCETLLQGPLLQDLKGLLADWCEYSELLGSEPEFFVLVGVFQGIVVMELSAKSQS